MEANKHKYTLKELKDDLNERQRLFCHYYLIDYNGTKAYMKAYPDAQYSTARVRASQYLDDERFIQYIGYIKKDLEKEAGLSKLMAIKKLKEFMTREDEEGKPIEVDDKIVISSIGELAKMLDWYTATKTDISIGRQIIVQDISGNVINEDEDYDSI